MDYSGLITLLYATVPIISTIGWFPQIYKLVKNPELGLGMSLQTWGMWTFTGIVSLLYIILETNNILLILTFFINALGQIIVFGYAIYARIRKNITLTEKLPQSIKK